jgi:2-keto-3-deoxy-6-phosphogluconate aldolase
LAVEFGNRPLIGDGTVMTEGQVAQVAAAEAFAMLDAGADALKLFSARAPARQRCA